MQDQLKDQLIEDDIHDNDDVEEVTPQRISARLLRGPILIGVIVVIVLIILFTIFGVSILMQLPPTQSSTGTFQHMAILVTSARLS